MPGSLPVRSARVILRSRREYGDAKEGRYRLHQASESVFEHDTLSIAAPDM